MKKIQAIQIWYNGVEKTATYISAIAQDNLSNTAQFYWQLLEGITDAEGNDAAGQSLASGNLSMTGQEYIDWNADPDINDAAYVWVCEQLNVTLS